MAPTEVAVQIVASSEQINPPPWPNPNFPKITLNGNPLPQPQQPPSSPSGFQVVVFNPALDITTPAAILANKYVPLYDNNGWSGTYGFMYDLVVSTVLAAGNVEQQTVFIASYGMDQNAPPNPVAIETMLGLGAGPQLQSWVLNCDPGSMGGSWVAYPVSYALVGSTSWGYGQGTEGYLDQAGPLTLNTTLQNYGS